MTAIVNKFLTELEKHEKDGTDSMDWAQWAHECIDEDIVETFSIEDWTYVK